MQEVDGFCRHLDEVASEGESYAARGGRALIIVSRKAAITAESQSGELNSMSSTISSTLGDLKTRSAQSAESASALSTNIIDSVSSSDPF